MRLHFALIFFSPFPCLNRLLMQQSVFRSCSCCTWRNAPKDTAMDLQTVTAISVMHLMDFQEQRLIHPPLSGETGKLCTPESPWKILFSHWLHQWVWRALPSVSHCLVLKPLNGLVFSSPSNLDRRAFIKYQMKHGSVSATLLKAKMP